jgi:hypothetical protein
VQKREKKKQKQQLFTTLAMALMMAENKQPMFQDFPRLDRGMTFKQQQQEQQKAKECYTSNVHVRTSSRNLVLILKTMLGPLEAHKKQAVALKPHLL